MCCFFANLDGLQEGELNEVHVELRIAKRELVSLSMAKESEMKELTTELEQIKREFGTCRATHVQSLLSTFPDFFFMSLLFKETELHAKDLEITGKSQELRKLEISKVRRLYLYLLNLSVI